MYADAAYPARSRRSRADRARGEKPLAAAAIERPNLVATDLRQGEGTDELPAVRRAGATLALPILSSELNVFLNGASVDCPTV